MRSLVFLTLLGVVALAVMHQPVSVQARPVVVKKQDHWTAFWLGVYTTLAAVVIFFVAVGSEVWRFIS